MAKIQQKIISIKQQIIVLLLKQVAILQKQLDAKQKREEFEQVIDKNEVIYRTVKSLLGQVLGKEKKELRCAECINNVFIKATGKPIGGKKSTLKMDNVLLLDKRFKAVPIENRKHGYVIISPTGKRLRWSRIEHGHVGIFLKDDKIASNNSKTGLLDDHWTFEKWLAYYGKQGKYPIRVFRLINS